SSCLKAAALSAGGSGSVCSVAGKGSGMALASAGVSNNNKQSKKAICN
ncbi:MAG: hypothetical protein INF44_02240, partial [Thalassospira sp.]|nr:hypothetical protein [Thalassospira sp.]